MGHDKPGPIADATHAYEDGEAQRLERMAKIGDRIRLSHDDWSAYFEQTVPLIADGKTLCLGLEKGHLFEKQLLSEEGRKIFEQAVRAEWGQNAILELVPRSEKADPSSTLAAERARIRARAHHEAIEQVKNHPRIREALEIFNGQVKNVTLPSSPR